MHLSLDCTLPVLTVVRYAMIIAMLYLGDTLIHEALGYPRLWITELLRNVAILILMFGSWGMTAFIAYASSVCPAAYPSPDPHAIAVAVFAFVLTWVVLQTTMDRAITRWFAYKGPLPKYIYIQQFYFLTRESADRFLAALQGKGVDAWTYPGQFKGKFLVEYGSRMDEGEARAMAEGLGLSINSIEYR